MIDRNSPMPLYCQLKAILMQELRSGALRPGDAVPSETSLCEKYGISRFTVRQALDELVRENMLERQRGRGTFVSSTACCQEEVEQEREPPSEPTLLAGVVVPKFTDWYSAAILSGIEQEIRSQGGAVLCGESQSNLAEETAVISRLSSAGATGLILFPADRREPLSYMEGLNSIGKPVVLVDRYFPGLNVDFVGSDNFSGAYQATEYLVKRGHRKILFLAVHALGVSPAAERIAGYRQALLDADIPFSDNDIVRHDFGLDVSEGWKLESYYENLAKLVFADSSYTAIFASNDLIALDVLRVAKMKGIRIPEDISLVGFDNRPFSALLERPLTTVEQSAEQIGAVAAKLLVDRMGNQDKPGERRILPVRLIERGTVAAPKLQ